MSEPFYFPAEIVDIRVKVDADKDLGGKLVLSFRPSQELIAKLMEVFRPQKEVVVYLNAIEGGRCGKN